MAQRVRQIFATAVALVCFMTLDTPAQQPDDWFTRVPAGRSVVRTSHAMVASSQPLASQTGLEILKRGGNAVDAAIAMAAVLNVTEPNMTGIGGDAFMMVYSAKTKKIEALNASGRAPRALTAERVAGLGHKQMPLSGMETITVPGAFDGWVTLLEKHGTMKLPDLLAPAIALAENGFPVMEKTVADWIPEVEKLRRTPASASTYLVNGEAPKPGDIFVQKNLARTLRTLAKGGRDAFYRGEIAQGHRRLLPEERRVSDDGGSRGAQVARGSSRSRRPTAATPFTSFRRTTRGSPRCCCSTSSKASTWRRCGTIRRATTTRSSRRRRLPSRIATATSPTRRSPRCRSRSCCPRTTRRSAAR